MAVILLSTLIATMCPQVVIDFSGRAFIMIICMVILNHFIGDNDADK